MATNQEKNVHAKGREGEGSILKTTEMFLFSGEKPEEAEETEIVFEEIDFARASLYLGISRFVCDQRLKGLKRLKRSMSFRIAA